jgi:molecular chaperone GrpE
MKRNSHPPIPADDPTTAPDTPAEGMPPQDEAMSAPEGSVTDLATQLAEAQGKLAAAEDRRLRLTADFDNYRKRVHRDLQEARATATVEGLSAFLNVFDHFRLAMAASEADPKVLRDGMAMILAEFEKAMVEAGIAIIDAVGQPFDPHCHEASAREPSTTVPENHVVRQWRCGYRLGDRLIRPAAVVVSAGPPDKAETPAAADRLDGGA